MEELQNKNPRQMITSVLGIISGWLGSEGRFNYEGFSFEA